MRGAAWWRLFRWGCLAAMALGVAVFVAYSAAAVAFPYPLDYVEGQSIYQVRLILQGVQTYQTLANDPQILVAYPPVWPHAMAAVAWLGGLGFWTGRLLSTLAVLAVAGLLGWMVAGETGDRGAGWVSGALFLSMPYVLATSCLARSDSWALLMSLLGVFVVWRSRGRGPWVWLAVLFFGLAGFTRQSNLLAGPLAACGWLWLRGQRGRALGFGLALVAAVAAAFLALNLWSDGGLFFSAFVVPADPYSPSLALSWVLRVLRTLPVFVGLAACFFFLGLAERKLGLAWVYLLGTGATVLLAGKFGSHVNYLMEFSAALAWVAGLLWARLRAESADAPWVQGLLAAVLAFGVLANLSTAQGLLPRLWNYREMAAEWAQVERYMGEAEGPVLADRAVGLLVLRGQQEIWQPFGHTSLARRGMWDQRPFVQRLERGDFPLILMDVDIADWTWTTEMRQAIAGRYELVDTQAGQWVYRVQAGQ
ncbi:MAG: cell envelope integrity protein CreD [Chloroflexi bacterium]|nr:cell envelope integrity protein CreD [Chloroflexota bacterium]